MLERCNKCDRCFNWAGITIRLTSTLKLWKQIMKYFNSRPAILGSMIAIALSIGLMGSSAAQEENVVFDDAPTLDNWSTGPEVGETIPAIVGMDQHGNEVTFDDVKGPNGAYIVFHRSADW